MRFSVFWALNILKGYALGGRMKRARNSDSETRVKKLNPTSSTEIRQKSLKYLFLETPCTEILHNGANLPKKG